MTPLLIGAKQKQAIRAVCALAEANPIDMLQRIEQLQTEVGKIAHMAQMTGQTIELPTAFLVTYSVELGHPAGKCRHLSVSIEREGRVPSPEGVWIIAQEFGFTGQIKDCARIWLEKVEGGGDAVNLLQAVER